MSEEDIYEFLKDVIEMTDRAIKRTASLVSKEQLSDAPENMVFFDAICLNLLVIGEKLKSLDNKTNGKYLSQYPDIPWKEIMRMRDIIAHHYTDIKNEIIYKTVINDIPELRKTLGLMINDLEKRKSLKGNTINAVIDRAKDPSAKSFTKEQYEFLEKFKSSAGPESFPDLWDAVVTEMEARSLRINPKWVEDTHQELMDFADGKVRDQSLGWHR